MNYTIKVERMWLDEWSLSKCASLARRWTKRLEPLAELGIETVYDLLTHFPFRYEDIQIRDKYHWTKKGTLKGL